MSNGLSIKGRNTEASGRHLRPRWVAVCLAATLLAGLGRPTPALADLCVGAGAEGFGNCFLNRVIHEGEFPFGITVVNSENRVVVVDYLSGLFFKYDRAAEFSSPDSQIFNAPFGPATYTGLATDDTSLFWIVDTGSGQMLAVTGLDGSAPSLMLPISSPSGGMIGDIAYNPTTGQIWAADIENDEYFSFSTTGLVDAASVIPSPGIEFAGEAYGNGIAVSTEGGSTFLDVPVGNPIDQKAARVERLASTDGSLTGFRYDLEEASGNLTWITGIAWASSESGPDSTFPVHYVVDGIDNSITEVPLILPDASGVIGVTCSADIFSNVNLTWTNTDNYLAIEIARDGTVIATVDGDDQEYIDPAVVDGAYTYTIAVQGVGSANFDSPIDCAVVSGRGRRLGDPAIVNGGNADMLAITIVESLTPALVYVADLNSGQTYRFEKDLSSTTAISSPFGMATTSGLAWNSDADNLFWINADTNELASTDLQGGNVTTIGTVTSPAGGLIGDITYAGGGLFWAVDITEDVYFQFDDTGATNGTSFTFPAGSGLGTGIAAVGASGLLDLPSGEGEGDIVSRLSRVDETGTLSSSFPTSPSTRSAFVNGVAWTANGSIDEESAYLVCNDTRTIVEVSLFALGAPFIRGDANSNGAVDLIDVTFTLFFLFSGGDAPTCFDSADADDSGTVGVGDASYLLMYLFAGDAPPPAPFATCDTDPTTDDPITCELFTGCP